MKAIAFLATADAQSACAFYRDTLGLELLEDSPFALVFDAGGCLLRIQKVEEVVVAPYTALGWSVDDIEARVDELVGMGVEFQRYPGMEQDERGIWNAPGAARVAWFRDPDGNTLSLTSTS